MYTDYGITFRIRTRAHCRRRVFSAAPSSPPNKKALSFYIRDSLSVRRVFRFFTCCIYFTAGLSPASLPSGTVLLSTRICYGDISYDDGGARFWENNRTWRPPDDVVQKLKKDWASTAYATVEFITDDNGVAEPRVKVTAADRFWNNCPIS